MMNDYVMNVCKIGQKQECCRYLMGGPNGFECAKLSEFMKSTIDARAHEMNAKGDNCDGMEGKIQ